MGGPSLRETRPVAADSPTLTPPRPQPASPSLPSTHPLPPPYPNFTPMHTGIPPSSMSLIFPPALHLIPTSTPPCLIFSQSQPFRSHSHFIPFPAPLPSSHPHSDFLTLTPKPPPCPGYLHCSFLWTRLLIFRREPPPFHACRAQTWLAVAPAFSRVARTLCWWDEDKPRPGSEAKPGKALHAAR